MRSFGKSWPSPEEESTWRRSSLLAEIVFFVLTCIGVTAGAVLLPGWFVMIGCLALAEFLIRAHHFWRTGVESALWIGGLYVFIFSLPSSGKPEALLVLGAAAAIAGWRVRNALFGTIAVCFVVAYLSVTHRSPLMFALAVSLIALFAVTRAWRRASTELLFQMLLIVMPIAGYIASLRDTTRTWMFFAVLAIVFAFVGIRRRLRVPLAASVVAVTLAIIGARLPLSLESQLIIGGAIALAVAGAMARALRKRTTGFVLDLSKPGDLESIATGVMPGLPVHAAAAGPAGVNPQGGEFGGAGASGGY